MNLKSILESVLFVNEKPISPEEIAQALDLEKKEVVASLEELKKDYNGRSSGLCVVNIAGGYQMCTSSASAEWIKKLYKGRFKQRLSSAALEVLAIVAYKQPVTRLEIESIRGVNCDQVVRTLSEISLIKIKGRKDVIGRPFLYGTSRKFLEYFGLNSLSELPRLKEEDSYKDGLKEVFPEVDITEGPEQENKPEAQEDGLKEVTQED